MVSFLLSLAAVTIVLQPWLTAAFRLCEKKGRAPHLQGREKFGFAIVNIDESLLWNETVNGGDGLGLFSASDAYNKVYAIGGTNDGGVDGVDYRYIQLYDFVNHSYRAVSDLNEVTNSHEFNPSSVRRVWYDLYLFMPYETSQYYYFWNSTSNTYSGKNNFPISGIVDYCLMYDTTYLTAVLTGGHLESDSSKHGLETWHILDLSSLLTGISDWSSVQWTTNYSSPVGRYGHSCAVLRNLGMVFGGFSRDSDKRASHEVEAFDFATHTWREKVNEKQKKKTLAQYKKNYWRIYGYCVTEQMGWRQSSRENLRAYCFGGLTNRSSANQAVARVLYDVSRDIVKIELGRKASTVAYTTKKGHVRGVGVMYNGSFLIQGGANQRGGVHSRMTVVSTRCGSRMHKIHQPLKGIFCVPYYVLYPVGCFSSWLIGCIVMCAFRQLAVDAFKDDSDESKVREIVMASASTKMLDTTDDAAIEQEFRSAIMGTLVVRQRFPTEIAAIVHDYFGAADFKQVLNQLYRNNRLWYSFLRVALYSFELLKITSLLACFVVLLMYFADFVHTYNSPWQQASALWLLFMYHPSVKSGAEVGYLIIYSMADQLPEKWQFDKDKYVFLLELRFFVTALAWMWLACVNVTAFWGGATVFVTWFICACVPGFIWLYLVIDIEDDSYQFRGWVKACEQKRVSKMWNDFRNNTAAAAALWAPVLALNLIMMISFAVFCTKYNWVHASRYGVVGDWNCTSPQFDWSDWRVWVLTVSWLI